MDHRDKWFSPEDVEEEIARYLGDREQRSTNTRMLQDLQHLSEEDEHRLAKIRAQLLEHMGGKTERASLSLPDDQHRSIQPLRRPGSRGSNQSRRLLVNLASGLAAILLIGSMLFASRYFGTHLAQRDNRNPQTSVTPSGTQDVHSISAFLVDATSGEVLADINSHIRKPIANLATIMTAVVAIEDANPDQDILVEQATLDTVSQGTGTAGLQAGDRIPLSDLLYGLLLPSGDDAALIIAQAVGGNTQQFVALMNDEAHQLQLNDTHFADPYNSPSLETYSSAADLGKLVNYAMQLAPFYRIVTAQEHTLAATSQHHSYQWRTTNSLPVADPNVHGIQVGYNARAGASAVFFIPNNNHLLIGVELNASSEKILGSDITRLLNSGSDR